ncbi:MAG: hypothetical protein ACLFV0_04590 [Nitriliruptoraceae bacterium]
MAPTPAEPGSTSASHVTWQAQASTPDALTERLHTWVAAGLLRPDQAARIADFEGASPPGGPSAPAQQDQAQAPGGRRGPLGRITLAEAIGYVGAALALGAIGLLLGELWRDLLVGGRLALVAVLTLAVFGAGVAVRDADSGAMARLSRVLFTATVAGVGWFASVVGDDVLSLPFDQAGLLVAVSLLAAAASLYRWQGGFLLQLATLAALVATAVALLGLSPLSPEPIWYGASVAAVGLAWFLLAAGGWLSPRVVGEVAGAVVALIGTQAAAFDDARIAALVVGLVGAAVLVWLAVRQDALHHLVVGATALFVLAPQLVFEVFGDAIGAPATLLLVGLLLVLLAVGLGRARREVVPDRPTDRNGDAS